MVGFQHVESTVTALVDIIHAFAIADPSKVGLAVKQYVKMLLCEVCGFIYWDVLILLKFNGEECLMVIACYSRVTGWLP